MNGDADALFRQGLNREAAFRHREAVRELRQLADETTRMASLLADNPSTAGDLASRLVNTATTLAMATRHTAGLAALNEAISLLDN